MYYAFLILAISRYFFFKKVAILDECSSVLGVLERHLPLQR